MKIANVMGHADERKLGLQIGLCGCIGEYVRYFHGRWAIIQDLVVFKRKLYGKLISCRGLEWNWIGFGCIGTFLWDIFAILSFIRMSKC